MSPDDRHEGRSEIINEFDDYDGTGEYYTLYDTISMWCVFIALMILLTTVLSPYFAYCEAEHCLHQHACREQYEAMVS